MFKLFRSAYKELQAWMPRDILSDLEVEVTHDDGSTEVVCRLVLSDVEKVDYEDRGMEGVLRIMAICERLPNEGGPPREDPPQRPCIWWIGTDETAVKGVEPQLLDVAA